MNGTDGNTYKALGGVYYRQGTATLETTPSPQPVPPIIPNIRPTSLGRLGRIGALTTALPITSATLILASADPEIAALVGRDPRAMFTADQWNAFYTLASGSPRAFLFSRPTCKAE